MFEATAILLQSLLNRFVKPAVFKKKKDVDLANLDLEGADNLLTFHHAVDIGIAAELELKQELPKKKLTSCTKFPSEFRNDCLVFLKKMGQQIQERSPLKYPAAKAISCLSPSIIYHHTKKAVIRMKSLLIIMLENKIIDEETVENCRREFSTLCDSVTSSSSDLGSLFLKWTEKIPLDKFFIQVSNHTSCHPEFNNLKELALQRLLKKGKSMEFDSDLAAETLFYCSTLGKT
jgi:hypothetical protein